MKINVKTCVFLATMLFLISIIAGYYTALTNQDWAWTYLVNNQPYAPSNPVWNYFSGFLQIFLNNVLLSLPSLIFGFTFVIPLFFIGLNGFFLGMLILLALQKVGTVTTILGLAPHGILEIPAMMLADGLGLWLFFVFNRSFKYGEPFKKPFFWALKKFLIIIYTAVLFSRNYRRISHSLSNELC